MNLKTNKKLKRLAYHGFYPFPVGRVTNPLKQNLRCEPHPKFSKVTTKQPARLEPIVLDYTKLVNVSKLQICTAGTISFGVDIYTVANVQLGGNSGEIIINRQTQRPSLVRHVALIMQSALGVSDGLIIDVESSVEAIHVGLGSSASLQTAVAAAINYLYGNPIEPCDLVRYLAQNHGEEIDGVPNHLIPVTSIGGSAAIGLLGGGMMLLSGEATLVARTPLPTHKNFIIGIPKSYTPQDALTLWANEAVTFDQMQQVGETSKYQIAYKVLHSILPGMVNGDFRTMGDVIWESRCNEQSLNRYDVAYPGLKKTALRLRELMELRKVDILSISSAGPAMFAYTSEINRDEIVEEFKQNNMDVWVTKPNNTGISYEAV